MWVVATVQVVYIGVEEELGTGEITVVIKWDIKGTNKKAIWIEVACSGAKASITSCRIS